MAISGPKLQVLNLFQFAFRNIVRMLLHCKQSFPKRKNCAENDYGSGINLKVLKPKTVSELDISTFTSSTFVYEILDVFFADWELEIIG